MQFPLLISVSFSLSPLPPTFAVAVSNTLPLHFFVVYIQALWTSTLAVSKIKHQAITPWQTTKFQMSPKLNVYAGAKIMLVKDWTFWVRSSTLSLTSPGFYMTTVQVF